MEFVVNEWLPEYFKPDAAKEEKEKLENFLNRFLVRNDKIFIRRPSEFLNKIYRFSKAYQNYPKVYENIHKFITVIFYDSNRCFIVDNDEFQLSEATKNRLIEGGNTASDTYLFEAASATNAKIILTTDVKLKEWMRNNDEFQVELLDDFLASY